MRQDGEVVHAMVSVSLTADSHDRPQGYIWQVVDVTEQRRAEAERAARAEAEAVVQTIGKLQQVTEAALAHLELDELLEVLVERVLRGVRRRRRCASCCATTTTSGCFTVGAAAGLETEPGTPVELGGALEEVVDERPPGDAPGAAARQRRSTRHRGGGGARR